MVVKRIDFAENGDVETVTVKLSIRELNLVNRVLSELSPAVIEHIAPTYDEELNEITETSSAMVYCRYWEEGLPGAIRSSRIPINEILLKYIKEKEGS